MPRQVDPVPLSRSKRAARAGILTNALLAAFKLIAGVLGNSYALVADAIESSADVVSSTIVLGGLQVSGREPNDQYPFGFGKAETLAGAVVALMLLGAAAAIGIQAVREIRTPHHTPAWWTLVVLVVVMTVKTLLSRRVAAVGAEIGSTAVQTDAWHHFSDALTSAAAFVGILVAVIGGPGWESADDWAALAASAVIAVNAILLLRPSVEDLMDRSPDGSVLESIRSIATQRPWCPRDRQTGGTARGIVIPRGRSRAGGSNPDAARCTYPWRRSHTRDPRPIATGAVGRRAHGTVRATPGLVLASVARFASNSSITADVAP